MTIRCRSNLKPGEAGFTLAFTIMLTMVFSLLAMAVMVRMYAGMRNAGFTKSHQTLADAANIGLTMALDELTPGLERMRNTVWSSYTGDATVSVVSAGYNLDANGNSTGQPLREFTVIGNIRNWEPFADWSQPYSDALCTSTAPNSWSKGWAFVSSASSNVQFFDQDAQSPACPVMVGGENTTGAYWYRQLQPTPPTGHPAAPKAWPNRSKEYDSGAFCSPVLKKVYTVRSNPLTRVAVYVRMSFQDYLDYTSNGVPRNVGFMGKSPNDPDTTGFTGANFFKDAAVTFSIFAVSEPTWASPGKAMSRGTRLHQALNIGVGGIEFVGGAKGIDTDVNTHHFIGGSTYPKFDYWTQPFFPPSLDVPRGDNSLVAGTPITGQVYPASGDLSYNFSGRQATDSVVFLYERIDLPNNGVVVFLIERLPKDIVTAGSPPALCYRRRLLYDWPGAYTSPSWREFTSLISPGSTPSSPFGEPEKAFDTIAWAPASYSTGFIATQDYDTKAWSSMGWFANKDTAKLALGGINKWYYVPRAEHFSTNSAAPDYGFSALTDADYKGTGIDAHKHRYPFTEWITRTGKFTIATTSAPSAFNVINWPSNPLMRWNQASRSFNIAMDATMPWEGPTVVNPARNATVSYFVSTWPYLTKSGWWWSAAGGRLGLSYGAALQTFY